MFGGDEVSNHQQFVSGSLALYINPVSVIEKETIFMGLPLQDGQNL
jgi:hypothetical protein